MLGFVVLFYLNLYLCCFCDTFGWVLVFVFVGCLCCVWVVLCCFWDMFGCACAALGLSLGYGCCVRL